MTGARSVVPDEGHGRNPVAHRAPKIEPGNMHCAHAPQPRAGKGNFRLVLHSLPRQDPVDVGAYHPKRRLTHDLRHQMADDELVRFTDELGVGLVHEEVSQVPAAPDDRRSGTIRRIQYRTEGSGGIGVPSEAWRAGSCHVARIARELERSTKCLFLPVTYQ